MDITVSFGGQPLTFSLGESTARAEAAAVSAEADADRAEAALASIIADPDVDELGTTTTINTNDKVVVYRAGVPLVFQGTIPRIGAQGAMLVGDTDLDRSADPTSRMGRHITATPEGSVHGLAIEDEHDWPDDGVSYAGVDIRPTKSGSQDMGHIGGGQSDPLITGEGAVDFVLHWIANLQQQAGTTGENIALHFPAPQVSGTGAVGASIGLNMPDMPEHNGDPGVPNYFIRAVGGARGRVTGQFTAPELYISATEGEANKMLHVESASGVDASFRLQQTGHNTLDFIIPAGSIDAKVVMNNIDHLVFDYNTAILPGGDAVFDLGSGSARWDNSFFAVASTVGSDARLKHVVSFRKDQAAALASWAQAIEPVCYQLLAARTEKGDKARLHWGVLAQQVHEAGVAAGVEDPFAHGFLCRDPLMERVRKTRTVKRPKTETVTRVSPEIELRDGVPVRVMVSREVEVPVTEARIVENESGEPVMIRVPSRPAKGSGKLAAFARRLMGKHGQGKKARVRHVPMMARVPVMEDREEEYFELEPVLIDGKPDYTWSIRYEELLMFLYAALRQRVTALEVA